ncbi:MAG: hypothetical protein R3C00_01940 [Hyphomonas sp.]|nr:hypothetical protein [Hyphomonas sp.]MCB9961363.1 hypothetical protein [Hyphomonas sp.]MCB9971538.1 hypothetical protein [Hyphomonas sp.]
MKLQYDRGAFGGTLSVEILDDRLRVGTREIRFDDIELLRYFSTESPQRTDYGLLISGKGVKLEINYISQRLGGPDPLREEAFNRVASEALAAIGRARPELEVRSGRSPLAATLIFLCFAIPAVLGFAMAFALGGESGTTQFVLVALCIGLASLVMAWSARPWQKGSSIPATDLAALFAADGATG